MNRRPHLWIAALPLCLAACNSPLRLTPTDAESVLGRHALDVDNPARTGPYGVRTLYYGSGTDKNRAEYRD
ncbi:MAG: hypothetical protein HKN73_18890, partial [Gemmatimonadetes bacterium]|nr:hypothetical protein [Gemmatimonadota bacterium]